MELKELMNNVNEWIKEIIKDKYVGVYFHGSLRLGSFNQNKSDLDFIIVINSKLTFDEKKKICDKMLENIELFPKKGFEFSVVLDRYCKDIIYPTPYELHMSEGWIERYNNAIKLVINEDKKIDPDLASHFNVINVPNDNLDFGRPSSEVFSIVPQEYVFKSNYSDIENACESIIDNPMYTILNLCRFYAYVKDNLTLSKYDGGKWALENTNWNSSIIKSAMDEYMNNININCDEDKLREFAKEAMQEINEYIKGEKYVL